jgi:flagellum-specific peptidoglycan hydrolase FlgJ
MAATELSGISSVIKRFSGSAGDFKQSANDNNRNMSKISKDLSSAVMSQKKEISNLNSAINESISASGQASAKIDSTNSLLQQSLQMQSEMLSQLKTIASYIKGGTGGKGDENSNGGLLDKFQGWASKNSSAIKVGAAGAGLGAMAGGASREAQTVPMKPGAQPSPNQQEYYNKVYEATLKAAKDKGVENPEVIARLAASQSSLETGYGKSVVGNNAFGIKADKGWKGESVGAGTKEVINGQTVGMQQNFRKYENFEQSAGDYVEFLQKNQRYKGVLAAKSPEEAIAAQGKTGYATDPSYGSKLSSIHSRFSGGANPDKLGSNQQPDAEGEPSKTGTSPGSTPGSMASLSGGNGKLDSGSLQPIEGGHKLQPAAAEAYKAMVDAARKEGINWSITDSYRTYDEQVKLAQQKGLYSQGGLAAYPGRSNHGWGTALDLGGGANVSGSKQNQWLQENAGKFGFATIPREPWHWEFKGEGVQKPQGGSEGGSEQAGMSMGGPGGMGMGGMSSQSIPFQPGMGSRGGMSMGMGGMGGGGLGMGVGMLMGGRTGGLIGGLVDSVASLFSPSGQKGPMPQTQASSGNITPSFAAPGSDQDTSANFFAADKANTAKILQQKATETAALRESADENASKKPEPQKTSTSENQPQKGQPANPGTKSDDSMFGKGNWAGDVLRYYGVNNATA